MNTLAQYHAEAEDLRRKHDHFKDSSKAAIRKLTLVDNYLDDLWGKVDDDRQLSQVLTELREAINLLN